MPQNPHRQPPSRRPAAPSGSRPRNAVKISASFGAPIIYLPRHTGSADGVEMDLGHMEWHSDFYWRRARAALTRFPPLGFVCVRFAGSESML